MRVAAIGFVLAALLLSFDRARACEGGGTWVTQVDLKELKAGRPLPLDQGSEWFGASLDSPNVLSGGWESPELRAHLLVTDSRDLLADAAEEIELTLGAPIIFAPIDFESVPQTSKPYSWFDGRTFVQIACDGTLISVPNQL